MSSFGGTVKLTGESEYRKALSEISSSLKVLNSEMKAVTSEYDKNDTSVKNLSSQNEVLNKKVEEQEKKVSILKEALEKARTETGDNSETTKKWQTELNNAQAELNKLNREVTTNEQLMRQEEEAVRKGYKSFDEMAEAEKKAQKETLTLGDMIKANLISDGIMDGLKGLASGIKAIGSAMFDFGKDVVNSFSELEQNLGGSEAVFGEYASSIQKAGEQAYKNLGVSQSEYLSTANKMGALFQGSGIEQQQSLELTEKAMQRAADMASVMGIDMESALEAVSGAAKGNFTMMDNLGVAMNATAVEAYAASKGLDFVWASASQAEKTEMAMQMFFENTEQYAGNFAKESTQTVSGALGLLSAAFESFKGGLGNTNADMNALTQNLVDAFQSVITNITPIVENLIAALPTALTAIIGAINEMAPKLLDTAAELFDSLLVSIVDMLPELVPVAISAVLKIVDTLIENIDMIIECGVQILVSLGSGLIKAIPDLVKKVPQIIKSIVTGLYQGIANSEIGTVGKNLVQGLWNGIKDATSWVLEKIKGFGKSILDGIKGIFGIHSPSTVFKDEVGKNLALGLGEGFADTMHDVTDEMQSAIPTEFDTEINANMRTAQSSMSTYDMMVSAFKQALTEVKVVLDDREMGTFVTDTVERSVFA